MENALSAAPVDRLVRQQLQDIYSQREEILAAFVAKYGFEPERAVQAEQRLEDGTTRWFVHRRSDEDMAAARDVEYG